MLRVTVSALTTVILLTGTPAPAGAQSAISLLAGPSWDLSGFGSAFATNVGFAWRPVGRGFVVEPGAGFFESTRGSEGGETTWFFPEISLQAELPAGPIYPYLGAGAGLGRRSSPDRDRWVSTLHFLVGVRVAVSEDWSLRSEFRIRLVDPFAESIGDLGVGFARRIF